MIYRKIWHERARDGHEWVCEGWFLFGFLPLFVRDLGSRGIYGYPATGVEAAK